MQNGHIFTHEYIFLFYVSSLVKFPKPYKIKYNKLYREVRFLRQAHCQQQKMPMNKNRKAGKNPKHPTCISALDHTALLYILKECEDIV